MLSWHFKLFGHNDFLNKNGDSLENGNNSLCYKLYEHVMSGLSPSQSPYATAVASSQQTPLVNDSKSVQNVAFLSRHYAHLLSSIKLSSY